MKSLIYLLLAILIGCGNVYAVEPELMERLARIDAQIAALTRIETSEAILMEKNLIARENALFSQLLSDSAALEGFVQMSDRLVSGMPQRFSQRLRFEVNQEKRVELIPMLDSLQPSASEVRDRAVEPVNVFVCGVEVDLKNGEWHQSPGSSRFWVSAEYPWLILSPVEYRYHLNSAQK